MNRSEVYSWRVSSKLKSALEQAARSQKTSVARLLERIVMEWLSRPSDSAEEEKETQRRIHTEAAKFMGQLDCRDPHLAERASERVRAILEENHGRNRIG